MPGNSDRIQYAIKEWISDNDMGTVEEISAGIGSSYSTVIRAIKQLETKGEVERLQRNSMRYVKWTMTGNASKMPYFKSTSGEYLPALSYFKDYVTQTRKFNKLDRGVVGQAILGICWAFAAATFEAVAGEFNKQGARRSLTMSRQEMIKALNKAERQVEFVREVLRDPKLNASKPAELIPWLLQDETNPIDIVEIRNNIQFLMRLDGEETK